MLSAVVTLLRRRNVENRLCCHNDENELEVTAVDRLGFVTRVRCTVCNQQMDTTCYDAKWTKERIIDETELKVGDHICWHRPYIIWHHAIVSTVNPSLKVIHYEAELKVAEDAWSETMSCSKCCESCDALYRINYQDSYNADYTTLRARKLLNEARYNLAERNCEHFSSWCKTGSTKSIQVSMFWTSCRRIAFTGLVRFMAFAVFFLFLFFEEKSAEDRTYHEKHGDHIYENVTKNVTKTYMYVEKWLACVYIVAITITFAIHSLIASLPRITAHRRYDIESPFLFAERYGACANNKCWSKRCICCLMCSCGSFCSQLFTQCCNCTCSPWTCWGRPGNLVCGLFFRIFLKEIPGLTGIVCIMIYQDAITTWSGIADSPPLVRAIAITGYTIIVQLGGYIVGAFWGRWAEAFCECSSWDSRKHDDDGVNV